MLSTAGLLLACAPQRAADPAPPPRDRAAAPATTSAPAPAKPVAAAPGDEAQVSAGPAWKVRPPAEVAKAGNHLASEGSVYLQQHAHNPLEWYPWGEEALARARAEDKPIFLSIGYSSCHWCHVMEHEVFEQEDVATYMNENWICIKVDREERPDLDAIYMDAVQKLTGRGGWPMTVFLTPALKPFFGGTYFPKAKFMRIAQDSLKKFREQRNEVENESDRIYAQIAANPQALPGGSISVGTLRALERKAAGALDPEWGGFRGRMKFPTPIRWRFLLHAFRKWGGESAAAAVKKTLDNMASGGIYDHVGGGFHRYTTEKTWLVPHFEKMLYDNGQLASLFFEAGAAFGAPEYTALGRDVLDFMLREWQDPEGGIYSSLDADSGGEEGTFYVWKPAELKALAGPIDGEALALLLGVSDRGNFEHRTSILTRRITYAEVAEQTGREAAAVEALWKAWRPKLYDVRAKRVWPGLDKKIVTAWNGLAIEGFARGYLATGDDRYRAAAVEAGEYLWRVHRRSEGGLYRASNGGKARELGVLDDYAFLASGLLELYSATGEVRWFERARALVDEAEARFARPEGGWFFAESTDPTVITRQMDPYDSVRPSGVSAMLDASLRLAALEGDPKRFDAVDDTLGTYSSLVGRSGLGTAGWASVDLRSKGPFYEVIIAGDAGDARTEALIDVWSEVLPSWAVLARVPAAGADDATVARLQPLFAKVGKDGGPLAYVCVRGSCKKPTAEPRELRAQLTEGWAR